MRLSQTVQYDAEPGAPGRVAHRSDLRVARVRGERAVAAHRERAVVRGSRSSRTGRAIQVRPTTPRSRRRLDRRDRERLVTSPRRTPVTGCGSSPPARRCPAAGARRRVRSVQVAQDVAEVADIGAPGRELSREEPRDRVGDGLVHRLPTEHEVAERLGDEVDVARPPVARRLLVEEAAEVVTEPTRSVKWCRHTHGSTPAARAASSTRR